MLRFDTVIRSLFELIFRGIPARHVFIGIGEDGQSCPAIVDAIVFVGDGRGAVKMEAAGYERALKGGSWVRVAEQTRLLAMIN